MLERREAGAYALEPEDEAAEAELRGLFEGWSMTGTRAADAARLSGLPLAKVRRYAASWQTPLTGRPAGLALRLPEDVQDIIVRAARKRGMRPSALCASILIAVARHDLFAGVLGDPR